MREGEGRGRSEMGSAALDVVVGVHEGFVHMDVLSGVI